MVIWMKNNGDQIYFDKANIYLRLSTLEFDLIIIFFFLFYLRYNILKECFESFCLVH